MREYAIAIFAVCLISGVLGLLSHKTFSSAQRFVFGVIILYVILTPLSDLAKNFDPDSLSGIFDSSVQTPDYSYESVAEDAFAEGIVKAVAEEFSLDRENIRIDIDGFDFENMCAKKIRIILSGGAALSDYREIESYINKINIGECKVEIEIG